MADVSVTFGAKDINLAKTIDGLQRDLGRLGAQSKTVGAQINSSFSAISKAGVKFAAGFATVMGAIRAAQSALQQFDAALAMGGRLDDLSQRTGEAAGNLLLLERAFNNAGAGADKVGPAINKLQQFMVNANNGAEAQTGILDRLGVSMEALIGKTPIEQMQIFASRIATIQDPAERAAAAMAIFGKSGGELLPILRSFDSEITKARGQLGSLPQIMNDSAQSFAAVEEQMVIINGKFTEFTAGILQKALPALQGFTEQLTKVDAAALGKEAFERLKTFADFLLGAFKSPGDLLIANLMQAEVHIKTLGNLLLNSVLNAIDFLVKAFQTNLPKATVQFLGGALEQTALRFARILTERLMDLSAMIGDLPGMREMSQRLISNLDQFNNKLMADQRANSQQLEASAKNLTTELKATLDISKTFKEDIFGAEEAGKRLAEQTKKIEENGKNFRKEIQGAIPPATSGGAPSSGGAAGVTPESEGTGAGAGGKRSAGGFQGRMPEPTNIGAQMRQAAEQARAQQRIVGARGEMFQRAMQEGRFGEAARLGRSIERRAEDQKRREDIIELGDIIERSFRSNVGVFGAKTATEKGIGGVTAREFARKSAFDQARELGIQTIGKSGSELRKEIDKSIKGFKDLQDGLDEETAQQQQRQKKGKMEGKPEKEERGGRTVVTAIDELKTEVMNRLPIVTLN